MRTVYLGTSRFAAAVLEELAESVHRPQLVVTRPDRPRGRGRQLQAPPVADAARELALEVIQPEKLHDEDVLERIAAAKPDVLIVCAYGVIIREQLLDKYEMFNVHPSLLPRWRGAAPIERAIMAGDKETGMSIMQVAAGLDSGPVYLKEAIPIRPGDDFGTVSERLENLGARLLIQALDEHPTPVPQNDDEAVYADKIEAADRLLDYRRSAAQLDCQIRGLRPHIGARMPLPGGEFLGVWEAQVSEGGDASAGGSSLGSDGLASASAGAAPDVPTIGGDSSAEPGSHNAPDRHTNPGSFSEEVSRVHADGKRLLLETADGTLELLEVQPAGGKRMTAAQWLRGRHDDTLSDFSLRELGDATV